MAMAARPMRSEVSIQPAQPHLLHLFSRSCGHGKVFQVAGGAADSTFSAVADVVDDSFGGDLQHIDLTDGVFLQKFERGLFASLPVILIGFSRWMPMWVALGTRTIMRWRKQ
jgi:hypothetical protein